MAKSQRTALLLMLSTWFLLAQMFVDDLALKGVLVGFQVLTVGLMVHGVMKKDPVLEAQQKRELRTQKIRELEAELDMTPMELWSDEDPDIVARADRKDSTQ